MKILLERIAAFNTQYLPHLRSVNWHVVKHLGSLPPTIPSNIRIILEAKNSFCNRLHYSIKDPAAWERSCALAQARAPRTHDTYPAFLWARL